jgi:hypothetical protein
VPISDRARAAVAAWAARSPGDSLWLFPSGKASQPGPPVPARPERSPPPPEFRPSGSARTCCATPSPPICSKAARTCACSSRCSAMPTSPRPRSTPMSTAPAGRAGQRRHPLADRPRVDAKPRRRLPAAADMLTYPRLRKTRSPSSTGASPSCARRRARRASISTPRSAGSRPSRRSCCARPMPS